MRVFKKESEESEEFRDRKGGWRSPEGGKSRRCLKKRGTAQSGLDPSHSAIQPSLLGSTFDVFVRLVANMK